MTFDQFALPFLLLEMHFEQRSRPEDEENLFQRSWYRIFENISAEVWARAVDRWITTNKWMPKPVEMREECFRVAAEVVQARDAARTDVLMQRSPLPPEDAERRAELMEKLRHLRDAKLLRGPAPAPNAPRLEDDHERE